MYLYSIYRTVSDCTGRKYYMYSTACEVRYEEVGSVQQDRVWVSESMHNVLCTV